MIICANMWGRILNSCLRFATCMSYFRCVILWWGSRLGPNISLRKIGLLHCLKPSQKWKVFWMWDGVKKSGWRRRTNFFLRKHAMKGNEIEGKTTQKGKSPNNFKARVSNPKEISLRRDLFWKGSNPRGVLMGSPKEHVSIAMKWDITPKIALNPNRGMGVLR